jgi:hypothetical protein
MQCLLTPLPVFFYTILYRSVFDRGFLILVKRDTTNISKDAAILEQKKEQNILEGCSYLSSRRSKTCLAARLLLARNIAKVQLGF